MSIMWQPKQETIGQLMAMIEKGEIALPQFQRPAVWQPAKDEIPFLIAILNSRPTGSLLTLDYGPRSDGEPKAFPVHALDGAPETSKEAAQLLLLDGQQRVTTLYRATTCGWTSTDKAGNLSVKRMILDVKAALDESEVLEDHLSLEPGADAAIPDMARTGRVDFRTLMNPNDLGEWTEAFLAAHSTAEDRPLRRAHLNSTIQGFSQVKDYRFPIMELAKQIDVSVVADIFEHMNSTGQALNRFDLMVARMFQPTADGEYYNLREEWSNLLAASPFLEQIGVSEDDGLMPLQLIAWRHVQKVTTNAVLELKPHLVLGESNEHPGLDLERAVKALESSAEFLATTCGVVAPTLLPQKAMLLPIASLHLREALNTEAQGLEPHQLRKWFFASCFNQPAPRYYGGVNSRVAEDCKVLEQWADHGKEPDYVAALDRNHVNDLDFREPMTRERNILGVAALALLVQSGAQDWSMNRPEVKTLETIHLHHMVPEQRLKKWFPGSGDDYQQRRRIANFAPISAKKNQKYGATEPAAVLDELEGHAEAVLVSHCADEETLRSAFLTARNFDKFCEDRSDRLKRMICDQLGLKSSL